MRLQKTLVDEMLVYSFMIVLLTGAFLAFFYTPGERVIYDGSFAPLLGIEMSGAYASTLRLSFDVRGGLFMRHLHQWASLIFLVGIVLRALLSRTLRQMPPGVALLGLAALNLVVGYALTDDLYAGRIVGGLPIAWWYGAHLLLALVVASALVLAWRRTGVQRPRVLSFVVICLNLTLLAFFFPLNQIWLSGPSR